MPEFTHLHLHTEYSLLDGACRIDNLLQKAKDYNFTSLAITDHGVLYGVIKFYEKCKEYNIKPIIGCEFYLSRTSRFDKSQPRVKEEETLYHIILLAKDLTGYENLLKLVTISYLEGFYYKPRIDKELLKKYNSGLIVLSGCIRGELPVLIRDNQYDKAKEVCLFYQSIFNNNFYIELQNQNLEGQDEINAGLIKLSKELKVPVVATNDVHYINKEDAKMQDVLICIQTQKGIKEENRLRFKTPEFYLKTSEQMKELFYQIPQAIENTQKITQECNLILNFDKLHFPTFHHEDLNGYFTMLCEEGLKNRYNRITQDVKARLDYELKVVMDKGLASYFLIMHDLTSYAKKEGIKIGPGRGSAAGSLISYCLGITDIDPIKYGLLFERFLNPEREALPDIDLDFEDEKRDRIIEFLINKYGKDKVAQIITFGTLQARAAVRDTGRVLDIPYKEVDRVAKLIPFGLSIDEALNDVQELKTYYEEDERIKEMIDIAKQIEGLPRHASTHAAGIVIGDEPLINLVPLQKSDGDIITQYDMFDLDKVGLLKMDILGLKTLTIINKTIELLKEKGIEVNFDNLDDKETYELLSSGRTYGVFQLESHGMRNLIKELNPQKIEDIIALLALYRPGPLKSGMVKDYINRKNGKSEVTYIHPLLEDILKETYGVILYQEQVMQIAHKLANFSLTEADKLRKYMGKKMIGEFRKFKNAFIKGAQQNNIDKEKAEEIFELMNHFGGYGFNKSHSAAYAIIAYQTAYLKTHYPLEFMLSTLQCLYYNQDDVAKYVREAQDNLGINILPPDINKSDVNFTEEAGSIRVGLSAIKNVGKASEVIINARRKYGKFTSLLDFCEKVDLRIVNKKVIESLIKVSCFDNLLNNRATLIASIENAITKAQTKQKERRKGQEALFEIIEEEPDYLVQMPEFSEDELLKYEKELLGFYLSSHPLKTIKEELELYRDKKIEELQDIPEGEIVKLGGIVRSLKEIIDKKNKLMAFVNLEDETSQVEVIIFSSIYEEYSKYIFKDAIIIVAGEVSKKEKILEDKEVEEVKIIAHEIMPFIKKEKKEEEKEFHHLNIRVNNKYELDKLEEILPNYKGNLQVILHLKSKGQDIKIVLEEKYKTAKTKELIDTLTTHFGKDAFWFE